MANETRVTSTRTFLPIAGRWAFLAGMIVSIVLGLIPTQSVGPAAQEWIGYILIVLGLIAGYLRFSNENQGQFILVAIGLAIFANSFGGIPVIGSYIIGMFSALAYFFGIVVVGVVVRNIVGWFAEQF